MAEFTSKTTKCAVIGEVAQAHDGSIGMAHAYIDAIADAGADAVKFQTHIADAESTLDEPWRVKFSRQDATRYDYWKRMEFTEEHWVGLRQHAVDRKLMFLSSPFSMQAVDMLDRVGVSAWKVASGEISNVPMLKRLVQSSRPMILSSGLSSFDELDEAVRLVQAHGLPLTVLQCTSAYPCPPEKIGLNMISELRQRYGCDTGLSDHSGTIYPGLAAATLGARAIELHVTFSRQMFGPDVPASVTMEELRQLVQGVDFIEKMLKNPVDKDSMAEDLGPLRAMFTKSIYVQYDLPEGTILTPEHLAYKKPGTGIAASRVSEVIGRKLKRAVMANARLSESDLELDSQ